MKLHVVACDILARPVYLCAARSPNVVDVTLHRIGLHDNPPNLRTALQRSIDSSPAGYDAVVLGYGLCGGAAAGIEARSVPVVLPRAHDCITLFLGARERYDAQMRDHGPTFWYVTDQLERRDESDYASMGAGYSADTEEEIQATYAEYVAKYGQDNADYLMEVLGGWRQHYQRGAFIAFDITDDAPAEAIARDQAERRSWEFEKVEGDLVLLRRLIDGDWGDDVLVLQPGERLAMSYDDGVVKAVPASSA